MKILLCSLLLSVLPSFEAHAVKPSAISYLLVQTYNEMSNLARPSIDDYLKQRTELLEQDKSRSLGYSLQLSPNELRANEIIMKAKWAEHDSGFANPHSFLPARHIFEVLDEIKESELFKMLRKMPKGAILHAHDTALVTSDYIVGLTYRANLWECRSATTNKISIFHFSLYKPSIVHSSGCVWKLVVDARREVGTDLYDAEVRSLLTLYTANPSEAFRDINYVWTKFMSIFEVAESIITYKPVWEAYYKRALTEFYEDGVQYLEFRGTLPPVYDLDGKIYSPVEIVGMYKTITDEFVAENEDFIGAKFIYAPVRIFNDSTIQEFISIAKTVAEGFPTFVAGFDLVGQEDLGRPLIDLMEHLLTLPDSMKTFFHAGETNWFGTSTDENLVDAISLGASRIGHGFALVKHPKLLELVKERNILIEVNPVSNQVLKLVEDFRNHPCAVLLADNYPVVISSDDPSFWETYPLTHDFYEAFLGMSARWQDLRLLKKLALNSLQYSSLTAEQKVVAEAKWQKWWDRFILEIIESETARKNV